MLIDQEYCCKLCKKEFTKGYNIDHAHGNGYVRGLLCIKCNTGLGKFNDDPALLQRAALYILLEGELDS